MFPLSTLAVGAFAFMTSVFAAPTPSAKIESRSCGQWFSGPAANFPPMSQWKDYNTIFSLNRNNMLANGDTNSDVSNIVSAINNTARNTGIEERILLAIIMQESHGNVGIISTPPGLETDRGLMQVHDGPGFPGQHGLTLAQIESIVNAGAIHFKDDLNSQGNGNDAVTIYSDLRRYNSGNVDPSDLSNGFRATPSYVSDVANRLIGAVC